MIYTITPINRKKIISPFWDLNGPLFVKKKIGAPFTQGYFVPSFVEIGREVPGEKMKMCEKFTERKMDRWTTGDQKTHFSFQKPGTCLSLT